MEGRAEGLGPDINCKAILLQQVQDCQLLGTGRQDFLADQSSGFVYRLRTKPKKSMCYPPRKNKVDHNNNNLQRTLIMLHLYGAILLRIIHF